MPDLKPCPMCRGRSDVFHTDFHGYKVVCLTCGMQTRGYDSIELAIARWNRRANDESD